MACFLVPVAEAVAASAFSKAMELREREPRGTDDVKAEKIPFSQKLKWLNKLLWGGSALLAFEHVWHGEIVPWFPFLTAAGNPLETAEMLGEMRTIGVSMAALVTLAWLGMVLVSNAFEKEHAEADLKEDAA